MEGLAGLGCQRPGLTCDSAGELGEQDQPDGVRDSGVKQSLYTRLHGLFIRYFSSDLFSREQRRVDEVVGGQLDWADSDDNKTQAEERSGQ
jgi:hypothetical protein